VLNSNAIYYGDVFLPLLYGNESNNIIQYECGRAAAGEGRHYSPFSLDLGRRGRGACGCRTVVSSYDARVPRDPRSNGYSCAELFADLRKFIASDLIARLTWYMIISVYRLRRFDKSHRRIYFYSLAPGENRPTPACT
jgi:hypothetical protein